MQLYVPDKAMTPQSKKKNPQENKRKNEIGHQGDIHRGNTMILLLSPGPDTN